MAGNRVAVLFEVDKDQQGRTVIRQIDRQLSGLGSTAGQAGRGIESSLSFLRGAIIVEFFRRGALAAFEFGKSAVDAFNEAQRAALGLQSVAIFRGLDSGEVTGAIQSLDLVKSGLLSVGDASAALKNLLSAGFGLSESIELIKRFGDSAAFGKQAGLTFAEAVVRTTEGIRNQNSILSDSAGIQKNLSVILRERGFELEDLSDKVKGAAAREALYQGLLVESQAQIGDAAKLTNTYAGDVARLDAQQQKILQTIGEQITQNPKLRQGLEATGKLLDKILSELKDPDSQLSKTIDDLTSAFGGFLSLLNTIYPILRDIFALAVRPVSTVLNPDFFGPDEQELRDRVQEESRFAAQRENFLRTERQRKAALEAERAAIAEAANPFSAAKNAVRDKVDAEINKSNDAYFRSLAQKNKAFADSQRQTVETFAGLRSQIHSVNPYTALFDQAESRQRDFLATLKGDTLKTALDLNQQLRSLEIFRTDLAQGSRLNDLITEQAKLAAGFGGQGLRDEAASREARRAEIEREIRAAQATGDFDTQRKLLDEFARTFETDRLAQVMAEATARQIATGQDLLGQADTATKRGLALDSIISATQNLASLTPEQVEARARALEQRVGIEAQIQAERAAREQEIINVQREQVDTTKELIQVLRQNVIVEVRAPQDSTVNRLPRNSL